MTNNSAAIEQEANEALCENRRELAEETAKFHTEPNLSEEAKARYVGDCQGRCAGKVRRERALENTGCLA